MNFDSAHPRSRGENCPSIRSRRLALGSSPLTRGKLKHLTLRQMVLRLIPAHAGKTPAPRSWKFSLSAHPRSRGENESILKGLDVLNGSSPLTRGKLNGGLEVLQGNRLIPAHAGKTSGRGLRTNARPAHPRSRGENLQVRRISCISCGSSPLTRGKQGLGH